MLKKIAKHLLFASTGPNRIRFGLSAGMKVQYDPSQRSQHLMGLYEREIIGFIKRGMKSASVLIDIGANDGYYGLAFAKQKNKEVLLCEPGPAKADLLLNMQLNGFKEGKDFKLIDKLVSGRNQENEISINDLINNRSNVFILMDVDGGEEEILRSFDFSSHSDIQWLIETHSAVLERNIITLLTANNYQVSIIKNAWWRKIIPEQRPLDHNRWIHANPIRK